jgi:hypothetical protein
MADFNTRDDGTPTAAHTWEEQFLPLREQGHVGPPPEYEIRKRLAVLESAIDEWSNHKAAGGWKREIAWRNKQLKRLKEESDGDAEHQE